MPAITSVLRGGISLVLVPLHGLGKDQVEGARNDEFGVEAYYVDEHPHDSNTNILMQHLRTFSTEEAAENTIILYVLPNSLKPFVYSQSNKRYDNEWYILFQDLSKRGLINLMAIDEAYAVEQAGRSF